jgi:ATP-binding cassette subfamily B protein
MIGNKMSNNRAFMKEVLSPFKWNLIWLGIIGFIGSIFAVVRAYTFKLLLNAFARYENVFWPVAYYIFAWTIVECMWRGRDYICVYFKPYVKKRIVTTIVSRMQKYDDYFFQQNNSGSLINGIKNLYDGIDDLTCVVEGLFRHFILVISALISCYIVNFHIGLLVSIWLITWGILSKYWAKNCYRMAFAMHISRTRLTHYLSDVFSNIAAIKIFGTEEYENSLTDKKAEEVAKIEYNREHMIFIMMCAQVILFLLLLIGVFWILIPLYYAKNITIGDLGMMLDLVITLFYYMFDFAQDLAELSEASGKISQGINMLYKEVISYKKINKIMHSKGGAITFENLHYRYPDASNNVVSLHNIINIPSGATVALVGASGSGKTTFAKLLLTLLRPVSGRILIDGQDVAMFDEASVRKIFAFVPQEVGLLHRTLRENIKYGSFDKSDQQMIAAAKKAKIHDFIMQLPRGYDSVYGADMNFSGGQKQRLMIARGLLRHARIFVFDESTSALDLKTESDILEGIYESTKGFTKLIIAHRLYTIQNADLILVCKDGDIVEHGTHVELKGRKGEYASLLKFG